mmetsp:Transcript_7600/g.19350  ORF Transcript_7600/g.19350 Transcript_7600/m.19350 type:complete len:207 (+) Transcript_7600:810-1430(+)
MPATGRHASRNVERSMRRVEQTKVSLMVSSMSEITLTPCGGIISTRVVKTRPSAAGVVATVVSQAPPGRGWALSDPPALARSSRSSTTACTVKCPAEFVRLDHSCSPCAVGSCNATATLRRQRVMKMETRFRSRTRRCASALECVMALAAVPLSTVSESSPAPCTAVQTAFCRAWHVSRRRGEVIRASLTHPRKLRSHSPWSSFCA